MKMIPSSQCDQALIMAALWNRAGHYIFVLWFILSSSFYLFSSPIFSRRRLDVYHTSTHGVALVQNKSLTLCDKITKVYTA